MERVDQNVRFFWNDDRWYLGKQGGTCPCPHSAPIERDPSGWLRVPAGVVVGNECSTLSPDFRWNRELHEITVQRENFRIIEMHERLETRQSARTGSVNDRSPFSVPATADDPGAVATKILGDPRRSVSADTPKEDRTGQTSQE